MGESILVTGGAGFIGSCFVLGWVERGLGPVVTLDRLGYAGHRVNLAGVEGNSAHRLVVGDICDGALVEQLLDEVQPRAVVHFAAESHVDRSIASPEGFVRTNVQGSFVLLEAARRYWAGLREEEKKGFRFLQVSTDEVYGEIEAEAEPVDEERRFNPSSPYAASKAAADLMALAYARTWGLPVLVSHCSNNYGPRQLPEKLIPLLVTRAIAGGALPIYGDGRQRRDWLHVEDHCEALRRILAAGRVGESYNIGGGEELENRVVAERICALLDDLRPLPGGKSYREQMVEATDRLGHDRRYAVASGKMECELGWRPQVRFEEGLRQTVRWYLENAEWVERVGADS